MKKFILIQLYNTIYITALTALVPILFTFELPSQIFIVNFSPLIALTVAIIGAIVGVIGLYKVYQDLKKTLFSLGILTMVPGIMALVLVLIGKPFIIIIFKIVRNSDPFIEKIIFTSIERAALGIGALAFSYIVIGSALVILSKKNLKDFF